MHVIQKFLKTALKELRIVFFYLTMIKDLYCTVACSPQRPFTLTMSYSKGGRGTEIEDLLGLEYRQIIS